MIRNDKWLISLVVFGLFIFSISPNTSVAENPPQNFSPDSRGFIQHWMILEPIRLTAVQLTEAGVQAAAKREYFDRQMTSVPKDQETVSVDGTKLVWHATSTK